MSLLSAFCVIITVGAHCSRLGWVGINLYYQVIGVGYGIQLLFSIVIGFDRLMYSM